ncbi:hypothetical protein ACFHW2_42745 [Actinomadura sp. LOL_016]|uniref:hypothetical protein n=1 Tax=unclassified Actinomadura TaxID=2626254 RepID=UPI003A803DAE
MSDSLTGGSVPRVPQFRACPKRPPSAGVRRRMRREVSAVRLDAFPGRLHAQVLGQVADMPGAG